MVLVQVEEGLETGVSLEPQLLIQPLSKVAQLAKETGMLTPFAPRLSSLCMFVCSSVKLHDQLLLRHLERLGITQLLLTPQLHQALTQPSPRQVQHAQVCNLFSCSRVLLVASCQLHYTTYITLHYSTLHYVLRCGSQSIQ